MSLYILDPLSVTISFHFAPSVSSKPYPPAEYSSKEGELFEHCRYPDTGCLHGRYTNKYFWASEWMIERSRKKYERKLMKCLTRNWPEGAACAARNLFRIARAVEVKHIEMKKSHYEA